MKRAQRKIFLEPALLTAAALAAFALAAFLSASNEDPGRLYATDYDPLTLQAVAIQYGEGDVSLSQQTGCWSLDGEDAPELDQEAVGKALATLCHLTATRRVETSRPLSEYGLRQPACTIRFLSGKPESSRCIEIGAYNPSLDAYYVRVEGESIYMVDRIAIQSLPTNPFDYADAPSLSRLSPENIFGIQVESGGQVFRLSLYDPASGILYTSSLDWQLDGYDGGPVGADTNTLYQFLYLLREVGREERADWEPENRSRYGLDAPQIVVTVEYEAVAYDGAGSAQTFTLQVGESGKDLYAKFAEHPLIYRLSLETAEALRSLSAPERFLSTRICQIHPEEITGLTIRQGSRSIDVEFDWESGSCLINEKPSEPEFAQQIVLCLTGMECYGLANDAELTEQLAVEIRRDVPGYERMTMAFSRYNADFYRVSFGRIDNYLINKNYVSVLENLIKEL